MTTVDKVKILDAKEQVIVVTKLVIPVQLGVDVEIIERAGV